ncbi:hypothetical protein [Streptomyces sp. NPDC051183]|uniref:hypothetical protein n=1 Tax=Streptomyces sp. NPDC051183 TaxID=3155165 RepID=UPI003414D7A8
MTDAFLEHLREAEELSAEVLGPYGARPPREDIDIVTGELIRLGLPLAAKIAAIPAGERFPRAEGAVADWTYYVAKGVLGPGDHLAWNYARGLARVVRSLALGIREHQPTSAL